MSDKLFTHENKSNVVFEIIWIVFFVYNVRKRKSILLKAAVNGKTMLSSDNTQRAFINSKRFR